MAKILFYLIVLFPIFSHAGPRPEYLQSDLDTYVHSDDASFNYVIKQVKEFDEYFIYSIKMNSQNFLQKKDVNQTTWSHWLTVIEPKEVKVETALLVKAQHIGFEDSEFFYGYDNQASFYVPYPKNIEPASLVMYKVFLNTKDQLQTVAIR